MTELGVTVTCPCGQSVTHEQWCPSVPRIVPIGVRSVADEHETARALRIRADAGRRVAFKTDYFKLPQAAQDALYGIAAELERAADEFDALAAREQTLRRERDRALKLRDDAINGRDDLPMSDIMLAHLQKAERELEELRAALAADAPAPEETP